MNSIDANSISSRQRSEFSNLKKSRRRRIMLPLMGLLLVVVCGQLLAFTLDRYLDNHNVNLARRTLVSTNAEWAAQILQNGDRYLEWLSRHGTRFEEDLFERVNNTVVVLASSSTDPRQSFIGRVSLVLLNAALQLTFLILASWRIWVVAVLAAGVLGIFAWLSLLQPNARNCWVWKNRLLLA